MKMNSSNKSGKAIDPLRPYSSIVLDGPERAPSRAMLYPVGFKPEDFKKPLIGIASTWSDVTPCNMHLDKLARESEKGANAGGGKAIVFNTITISDGISMGSEGMKYSLISREVIADSIETVVGCGGMDGLSFSASDGEKVTDSSRRNQMKAEGRMRCGALTIRSR